MKIYVGDIFQFDPIIAPLNRVRPWAKQKNYDKFCFNGKWMQQSSQKSSNSEYVEVSLCGAIREHGPEEPFFCVPSEKCG